MSEQTSVETGSGSGVKADGRVPAIELRNITKTFGEVIANQDISLNVYRGEILSVLGENGSGKTTLMNMISGIYYPDSGEILIDGEEVLIRSPKDAFRYKIGMIHQHFKLIDVFTATENIVLGLNDGRYDLATYEERVKEICERYGFVLDPKKKVYDMSVSEKQTVEIIKVLFRGADILILDEPTAVLTPQETDRLFNVLRRMRADGKAIIIITHKLHEVLSLSDRVSVLCKGRYIGTVITAETNEQKLTEMMVGEKVDLNIRRSDPPAGSVPRLVVNNLVCKNEDGIDVLKNITFSAMSGEILGIAGIAGSGQRELLESIAGLEKLESGEITYNNPATGAAENLRNKSPRQIRELGVRLSFVPEDRLGMGLVGNMDIIDNMMLRSYRGGRGLFLNRTDPASLAEKIINDLGVVTPGAKTPVRRLSGGNVQKVLVGREIASAPTVLMVAYPVRGLDINSSFTIYNLLNEQKEKGVSVIFVGEDLDVLIELCDRILVLSSGQISGIVDPRVQPEGISLKEQIGLLMTKNVSGEAEAAKEATESTEPKAPKEVSESETSSDREKEEAHD